MPPTRLDYLLVASFALFLLACLPIIQAAPSPTSPLLLLLLDPRQDAGASTSASATTSDCEASTNTSGGSTTVITPCYRSIVGGESPVGPLTSEVGITFTATTGSISSVTTLDGSDDGSSSTIEGYTTSDAISRTTSATSAASTSVPATSVGAGTATPASTNGATRGQPMSQLAWLATASLLLSGVMVSIT